MKHFIRGIYSDLWYWFNDKSWDNDVCGPGYRSRYEFNWGKLSFILLAIILVVVLIVVL